MTRFTTTTTYTSGTGDLIVMTRPSTDLAVLASARIALSLARTYLRRTITALQAPKGPKNCAPLAARYFLTPATEIDAPSLLQILQILELTKVGLAGDVTIKTGNLVGSGDDDVNGEVMALTGGVPSKPYHNVVTDLGDGLSKVWGAIKVEDARLKSGSLGTKTLIHEATHKYAGTDDYRYFDDDGFTPRGPFTDKAKALINADSYAWFVLNTGKATTG